jgi:hypothetical protein
MFNYTSIITDVALTVPSMLAFQGPIPRLPKPWQSTKLNAQNSKRPPLSTSSLPRTPSKIKSRLQLAESVVPRRYGPSMRDGTTPEAISINRRSNMLLHQMRGSPRWCAASIWGVVRTSHNSSSTSDFNNITFFMPSYISCG